MMNAALRHSARCGVVAPGRGCTRQHCIQARRNIAAPARRPVAARAAEANPQDVQPATSQALTTSGRTVDDVKAALLDAITGTERGLTARSEVRAEINELVNQLEVVGGAATDVKNVDFEGTWELIFSNATDIVALFGINRLPFFPIKIGAVTQRIDAATATVENAVKLSFPLISTSLSTVSTYDVASPKRLQYTVLRGVLHTPSIEGSLDLPSTITFMGQTIDLTPFRDVLAPLTKSASGLAASAADLLGQAPDLELPLNNAPAGWQLTTYLDPTLRVTRGDGGAVYIFKKDFE